jgi:hypothetical protein
MPHFFTYFYCTITTGKQVSQLWKGVFSELYWRVYREDAFETMSFNMNIRYAAANSRKFLPN